MIDFNAYASSYLSGWDGNSNPFGSGYMQLVQSGADTLLQIDANGVRVASLGNGCPTR